MALQTRIFLLVTSLLIIVVLGTTAVLTWMMQRAMVDQVETDGQAIASLLARSASFADNVPEDVEDVIGEQMIVNARIAAHLVAIAEQSGMDPETITDIFVSITETSVLDEVWVTDEEGHAYITTEGIDFTFSPDQAEQPQASAFWPLLSREQDVVVQDAMVREIDESAFKYVGVSGVDKPRIVEVGTNASLLDDLEAQMGPARLADEIVASGTVSSIHILDHNFASVASSGIGGDTSRTWQQIDRQLRSSITVGEMVTVQGNDELEIAAPIVDRDDRVIGAVLVAIPTTAMQEAMRDNIVVAVLVAIAVVLLGVLASLAIARWVAAPVARLTTAAKSVEDGSCDPDTLDGVAARNDGLGQLARVFQSMAREVLQREQRLKEQVRELRIEIDRTQEARQVSEIVETDYFQDLQARAQQLRNRQSPARSQPDPSTS